MVMFFLALTFLAWATQTLFHQWGFGAELPVERFVPAINASGALEMKSEASVMGGDVTLKQICRWSDADRAAFEPVADLVVMRVEVGKAYRAVTLDELKDVLAGAGVNLASVRISGATKCTVARADVQVDESQALKDWVNQRTTAAQPAAAQPAAARVAAVVEEKADGIRTLREILIADLAQRVALPADTLQVSFRKGDEKLLAMSEPQFEFGVTANGRVPRLGNVSWEVTIGKGEKDQKVTLTAIAKAWRQQIVARGPIAFKQVIRAEDVEEKRMLVDRLEEGAPLALAQVVGQQAATELKPGAVFAPRNIEPVPLVRSGQLVTVTVAQGGVQLKTAARAIEGGAYGQSIRVRNEATKDVYEVTLTGPQTAVMGSAQIAPAARELAQAK